MKDLLSGEPGWSLFKLSRWGRHEERWGVSEHLAQCLVFSPHDRTGNRWINHVAYSVVFSQIPKFCPRLPRVLLCHEFLQGNICRFASMCLFGNHKLIDRDPFSVVELDWYIFAQVMFPLAHSCSSLISLNYFPSMKKLLAIVHGTTWQYIQQGTSGRSEMLGGHSLFNIVLNECRKQIFSWNLVLRGKDFRLGGRMKMMMAEMMCDCLFLSH